SPAAKAAGLPGQDTSEDGPVDWKSADRMPAIKSVMTPFPYFVEIDAPIAAAEQIMREHGVRHVPVQENGEPVGVVSQRDVGFLVNPALGDSERSRISVRHICIRDDVFVVELETSLAYVLSEMARRHVGSALVVRKGRLAGIFTTTDACRSMADLLRDRYEPGPDEVA
ncbi:MAG: CBS domain-containing protein, partial [Myxococcota bacterium]